MRIAEGLEMLEVQLGYMVIHPTILFDGDSWTLVDTGMPGSAPAIRELARQAGIGEKTLRSIILTHQDLDHVGGLPGILADEREPVAVLAHPDDEGAINGTQPMIKMNPEQLEGFLQQLPEETRAEFEQTFLRPSRPNVNRTIVDGEKLPIAGGLTVIHTPGHTPGHVCLYHHASKTLIAGDAMVAADGVLSGPNPSVTPNLEQALDSLNKLKAFDIAQVVCYHGGLVQGGVNERIAELAERK
ncbi:MBL fold metallo-hydrolase [Cohnella terricola]|uniref:MBL fold metallo-hydrolase n=1 Tax=Cohnella terricola TaxID=1289167 RepID=A0A559JQ79_9BACL|nr:MBL fold metallo-hydrolase [Cohnella terricola]TVY02017.1 MBL fold metallo-hydrolase [Cohnella terricola]